MILVYLSVLFSSTFAYEDDIYKDKYFVDESHPAAKEHNDCLRRKNHDLLEQNIACYITERNDGDVDHTSMMILTDCLMKWRNDHRSDSKGNSRTYTKAEDQQECYCERALKHPGSFCYEPGHSLSSVPSDVEKEVCTGSGKLKFYGLMCKDDMFHEHLVQSGKLKEEGYKSHSADVTWDEDY